MADKNYEIEFGGQSIRVPAWATQEQIENLASLSKDNITKLEKLTQIETGSLKAVTEMLKEQTRRGNQTVISNERLIKELKAGQKDIKDAVDKNTEETKRSKDEENAKQKKLREEREKAEQDLINSMKRGIEGIRKSTKDAVNSISKGDFEGLATAVGSVVGLGAAAGFAAQTLVSFSKALGELSNVGAGFGYALTDLRNLGALAGTGLEGLAKIANSNSIAFRALGNSTNEGLEQFVRLSREARGLYFSDSDVQERARDLGINVTSVMQEAASSGKSAADAMQELRDQTYGLTGDIRFLGRSLTQFGMSNEEVNQLLAEEIELRRLDGQSASQIEAEAADSMRELISETTKLANVTGVNRREAMRVGLDAAANDALLRDFKNQFSGEYGVITGALAEGPGEDIGIALAQAISDPEGYDVTTLLSMQNEELFQALNRIPGAIDRLQALQDFGRQNIGTMDTETFNATFISSMARLTDGFTDSQIQQQTRLARSGTDPVAGLAVSFDASLNGLTRNMEDILAANRATPGINQGDEASTVDFNARVDSLTNAMKAGALDDALGFVRTISGVDPNASDAELVQAMSRMENNFVELGFLGAIKDELLEANGYLKAIAGALVFGALAGPVAGLFRGGAAAARLGGRGLSRARNFFRGSAAPTGAAGAATTGVRAAAGAADDVASAGAKAAAGAADDVASAGAKAAAGAADDVAGAAARTVGAEVAEQVAETTAKSLGKGIVKKIPLIGAVAGLGLGAWRAMEGDYLGAGMEVASGGASLVPGVGTAASIAIDAALLARDISKVYTDSGYSEEDAARFGAMDASESMIAEMTDRITRAEGGENVYWGRDSVGIAEDKSDMQDLLLSEIVRLTDVMETTGELSQREADALANYNQMLSEMDTQSGMEILAGSISELSEGDQAGALMMAEKVDDLKAKLDSGTLGDTEKASVMKEYVSALNELKQVEEKGITDEAKRQARIAEIKGVDIEALMEERETATGERLEEINKTLDSLNELKPGDISMPSDNILKMHKATASKLEKDTAERKAMEQEQAPKAIGFDEERYNALRKAFNGFYSDDELRQEATIMGYDDEEKNAKYQKLLKDTLAGEQKLQSIEQDERYQSARANELAREMGISNEKLEISEDGSAVSYSSKNSYSKRGGKLIVNGQVVPDELLTDREKGTFAAQSNASDQMNNRPVSSPVVKANENQDTTEGTNNNNTNRQTEPEKTRDLLEENNRLLRKTIETIENGQ